MTLEESKEIIPMLEDMINQIEEQQGIMAEMYQEMQERNQQLLQSQGQKQKLQELNGELQEQLAILPDIEEMLNLLEIRDGRIEELEIENQQWKELVETLNGENALLQRQNAELMKLNRG